jgi:hypothetical protein
MTFDSYYWHGARTASANLERAREQLAEGCDVAAFALLLRSADQVAVGIAMDQFHYAEAMMRHGSANGFAAYADEVAARAREVLREPPSGPDLGAEPGANHASAFGALMNMAEPDDAGLIADALASAGTGNLRFAASLAATSALDKSASPDGRLIAELERLVLDADAGNDERTAALAAITAARSAAGTAALITVTGLADVRMQATAALQLLDRDPLAHRARVAELVRGWPKDAPYPANEVLELLAANPSRRC